MVDVIRTGAFLYDEDTLLIDDGLSLEVNHFLRAQHKHEIDAADLDRLMAKTRTMTHAILSAHDTSSGENRIKFDALVSHDITYVGIIQTARASGLLRFPVPYALTNCHNSLCAVGGTINEDDHVFGLSAAKKYGGIYVPAHQAVIHAFAREMMANCGSMILGSDSHTRYGALGTMGIGEGGPELVKQLLGNTYDIPSPEVVLVYMTGASKAGVGPHDVALALIKAVFADGFVKNKVLEFAGPGVKNLSVDYRCGIDVMTTETACLSSIWTTDDKIKEYYTVHGRAQAYKKLAPRSMAYYDGVIKIDLSSAECMIAMPFHPSNAYTVKELNENAKDILALVETEANKQFPSVAYSLKNKIKDGRVHVDQGVVAGCAGGTFENICAVADILKNSSTGNDYFSLSIYPQSQPVNFALTNNGTMATLMRAGATIRTAFCGPCFGAGDVPANNGLSIRHSTRNFPNREGSKPGQGQLSAVALMDARSIAATAANGGRLTAASELGNPEPTQKYTFDRTAYDHRVYFGFGKGMSDEQLKFGPNIADWPKMYPLSNNVLLKLVCVIKDPVTTTDELIPSGETSSYRSNPLKLAEFTLSRKDPAYVGNAKAVQQLELQRRDGQTPQEAVRDLHMMGMDASLQDTAIGSVVFAIKPGDGSAREQAASCQRVLGGLANVCYEYATKRYRSNLINWGILPFTIDKETVFDYEPQSFIYVANVREAVQTGRDNISAKVLSPSGEISDLMLHIGQLTHDERYILLSGCLINFYAER